MILNLLNYSIVLAAAYLAAVAMLAIASALRAGGRRDDAGDDHEVLAASRFTIPVSIVVPVSTTSCSIRRSVSALLELNYPEFEVIVVADAGQGVLEQLGRDWHLEAREFFYREMIETSAVRRIYRSERDPRLMVIDKTAAGFSDALNCGVNVARYRYLMSADPDVIFDRDALLRVMMAALRDPANVIGASNHVERGGSTWDDTPVATDRATGDSAGPFARLTRRFEQLASARSLMNSRLMWRNLSAGLGPADSIVVWRRDALIKANGFSATAAEPSLDMMFRLQTAGADGGRFDRDAEVFGRVNPQSFRSAFRAAARRQRAALEIAAARVRSRARAFDTKTFLYFISCEIVTPAAQAWLLTGTLVGAALGWFSWTSVFFAAIALSFGNSAVSAAALLLRGATAGAPLESELRRLVAAGPLEFILYRSALGASRLAATIAFAVGKNQ